MVYNITKLVVAGVLVVALIVAVLVDPDSKTWVVPLLTLLVGYVVGNASFTDISAIAAKPSPPPPPPEFP